MQDYNKSKSGLYSNDEIDLRELFFILWNKKSWIILSTLVVVILSTIYAIKQPNIYESKAVFKINGDPYDTFASRGEMIRLSIASEQPFEYLRSHTLKQKISEVAKQPTLVLNISLNKKTSEISVSAQGQSAQKVFEQVLAYSQYVNQIYVKQELGRVQAQLTPVKVLLKKQMLPEVKQAIADKYAYLLYKEALLESGSVELVKLINKAVKPVSHIKPKRALIIALATILAVIFSVFVILLHNFMIKKES